MTRVACAFWTEDAVAVDVNCPAVLIPIGVDIRVASSDTEVDAAASRSCQR